MEKHTVEGPRLLPKPEAPRLLYSRIEAARQLSIGIRMLDYLIANKELLTRRIRGRVLVSHGELVKFSRRDHFGPIAETV